MIPEDLRAYADRIESLRADLLFDDRAGFAGDDPEAVSYFLLALAALESARRFMDLATLKQTRAIADFHGGKRS